MSNGISKTDLNLIPAGYKQTEVGVIPEDWEVLDFGSMFQRTISKKFIKPNSLVSFVGMQDVTEQARLSSQHLMAIEDVKNGFTYFERGDILVAKITPCFENGKGCHTESLLTCIGFGSTEFHVLRATNNSDSKFIYYWSNRDIFRQSLESEMVGSAGHRRVPLSAIANYQIPIPPKKEQTAIANVLSDVDSLISELEKLIAKKQAIKTATMQQLLTGRTRLPQFALRGDGSKKNTKQSELGEIPEDWEKFTFDEVISFCSSGATPYRGNKSFYKGTIRWITSGELNYCTIYDTIEKISDDAVLKANLKIHPAGTFLMAITGLEAAGTRGACGITGQPSATNQSCMAIYPNEKLITPYLYFWYTYNGEDLAFKYCQGTKQLSYTAGLIKKIPLYLPVDIKEQTAIATILSDMDEEIQVLEQRLSKTRQIKQGMMQELLTGKTRLVQPSPTDVCHVD
ncbi:restriction endonuclease subunit S [Proteus mirabilis]